jgi:hypothetical protein
VEPRMEIFFNTNASESNAVYCQLLHKAPASEEAGYNDTKAKKTLKFFS